MIRAASTSRIVVAAFLATAAATAQEPAALVRELATAGDDAGRAELARRRLLAVDAGAIPAPALITLLRHEDRAVVRAASSVLRAHGLARDQRRVLLASDDPTRRRLALDVATPQELVACLDSPDVDLAREALWQLEDRGALDDALLARTISGDRELVAKAAVRIAVLERSPFPVGALTQLQGDGIFRALEALADRSRGATAPWLHGLLADADRPPAERLLAMAALPREAFTMDLGREVVGRAGDAELDALARRAAQRMPAVVADRLVGAAHARIVGGTAPERVLACLVNASEIGERQVLALSGILRQDDVEYVCQWLQAREAKGLAERIASALDGETPLENHLLRRAADHVDRPARVDRVAAVLRDDDDRERQLLAFHALVRAGVFRPALLTFALAEHDGDRLSDRRSAARRRLRALLRMPLAAFPEDVLLGLLGHPVSGVRLETMQALSRAPFPVAVEAALLRLEKNDPVGAGARAPLVAQGSKAAMLKLWSHAETRTRIAMIRQLVEHRRPWTKGFLAAEVDAYTLGAFAGHGTGREHRELYLECHVGLAALGDANAFDELLDNLSALSMKQLRRCSSFATAMLRADHVPLLTRLVRGPDALDDEVRAELVSWLADRPDLDTDELLRALWQNDAVDEIRYEALGGLLRGPAGDPLHQRVRDAMAGPLRGDDLDLLREIIGNAGTPLDEREVETFAFALLHAPLATPREEAASSDGGLPGRADYPLHRGVVDALRRDKAVNAAAFARVVRLLEEHPDRCALAGRRVGHLLASLVRFPHLRIRLGPVVARVALGCPDLDNPYRGGAHLILGEAAEDAGDHGAAHDHYRAAATTLLRRPLPSLVQRGFVGEQTDDSPAPDAAILARAWLCAARVHHAAGDAEAARDALRQAHDLGEGDAPLATATRAFKLELER